VVLIETGSPIWVSDQIQAFTAKIFDGFCRLLGSEKRIHGFLFASSLSVLIVYHHWLHESLTGWYFPFLGRLALVSNIAYPMLWVCLVASMIRLLRPKAFPGYFFALGIVFFVVKGFAGIGRGAIYAPLAQLLYFIGLAVLLGIISAVSKTAWKYSRSLSFFVIGLISYETLWWGFGHWGPSWASFNNWYLDFLPERMIAPLVLFWGEWTNVNREVPLFSREQLGRLFCPVNLYFPLPIESKAYNLDYEKLARIRLQGLSDILVAAVAMLCYYKLNSYIFGNLQHYQSDALRNVEFGVLQFVKSFSKSIWIVRVSIGIGRWIGIDLKDGSNFAILAVNPMDRWKRWNVYYVNWLRDFVYFPFLRITRSPFASTMGCFAVTFVLHAFTDFCSIGLTSLNSFAIFQVRSFFVHFFVLGIIQWQSAKWSGIWPSGRTRRGWIGVFFTISIVSFSHWISSII